jgi:hypothetical protein
VTAVISSSSGDAGCFGHVKRELVLDVDPDLYPETEGSADSE